MELLDEQTKRIDFQAYGMFHANHAPTLHKD